MKKTLKKFLMIGIMAVVIVSSATNVKMIFEGKEKQALQDNQSSAAVNKTIPSELEELKKRNPETEKFVLGYPGVEKEIDLSNMLGKSEVPLLLQWDERWGYTKYAGDYFACSGCGPTALSMVCLYLMDNPEYSPRYIADFSEKMGYCVSGGGSTWTLISVGAKKLGLDVTEIPLHKKRILDNLNADNPIICVVGKGDFTSTGHFIVLTGYTLSLIHI